MHKKKLQKANYLKNNLKTIGLSSLLLFCTQELTAQTMWAKDGNNLVSFNSSTPSTVLSSGTITNVAAGQSLKGIDFRPATAEMYGLGYNELTGESQLYKINTTTFMASPVGGMFMLQTGATDLGFDFNPTVDRIRITTKQGKNYRVHPDTGVLLFIDGDLTYNTGDSNQGTSPMIGSVAYTNSYIGATSTTLFDLDDNLGILAIQNPPNAGGLMTVGTTGIVGSMGATSEIDIYWNSMTMMNEARIATETTGGVTLYNLNTTTGVATSIGMIGSLTNVDDLVSQVNLNLPSIVAGQTIYALNSSGYLISFDSESPSTVRTQKSIAGITAGQVVSGLDFRPATGQLYALGYNVSNGETQLYILNPITAAATPVAPSVALASGMTHLSFDFNPTVDRIRLTSSIGNNYRLHPVTGALAAMDGMLAFGAGDENNGATPMIVAGAYTNSYIGSTSTGLYGYNATTNSITFQNPPNNGTLITQGASGISINPSDPTIDFDFFFNPISLQNQNFMAANVGSTSFDNLYTVNLMSGATQLIGMIGQGIAVVDIAVQISPNVPMDIAGELIYGITSTNHLISFDSENPATVRSQIGITGLVTGQQIVGMDVRPATGELYCLGYNVTSGEAQIYTLNPMNGILSSIGSPSMIASGILHIGFDFNPTVDRIRVTGSNGSNLRFHPTTGALLFTDGNLMFSAMDENANETPMIGSVAYTNSYGGSNVTTLYNYDHALNTFTKQVPPNDGKLNSIGTSGILVNVLDKTADFDVYYDHVEHVNKVYLAANEMTNDKLYHVNLTTGETQEIGLIGLGIAVRNIAVKITEITTTTSTSSTLTISNCGDYTSPNGTVYNQSGTYTNVIPNAAMYDSLITINLTINPTISAEIMISNDTSLIALPVGATFEWLNCTTNSIIAGQTSSIWSPMSGNYAVIATNSAGCKDTSACMSFQQTATLNGLANEIYKLYPNPTSESLTIEFPDNIVATLQILDQYGRIVADIQLDGTQINLDLTDLTPGVYFVSFNQQIARFVKI